MVDAFDVVDVLPLREVSLTELMDPNENDRLRHRSHLPPSFLPVVVSPIHAAKEKDERRCPAESCACFSATGLALCVASSCAQNEPRRVGQIFFNPE